MKTKIALAALGLAAVTACSKEAPPKASPPPAPPIAAPVAPPAPPPEPVPAPPPPPPEPAKRAPAAALKPPPATPAPAPTLATTHGKVGDAKCRMCHRLQHDSWSASPHAAKGLDCEGCHGGGADFVKVMRDRTAALAAGLMLPTKDFCKKCHAANWSDAMLSRVHAHKVK